MYLFKKMMKRLFLILVSAVAAMAASPGQTTPDSSPKRVKLSVEKAVRADSGELLLGVRILAEGGPLTLQGTGKSGGDADGPPPAFSLAHAYILDTASGQKIPALATLPHRPFLGPLEIVTVILKGDWIEMGVAFPFPATPPPTPGAGGSPKSQLLLYLPLDAKPVPITLPSP